MDPSSGLDPPENNNVELRPFVQGSRSTRLSGLGSAERNQTGSYLDTYLSSTPQRKKGLLVLLSILCFSLLVMTVVKRGAVDVEQKVELGETESAHHANLDHHQGGSENVAQAQPMEPVGAPAAPALPDVVVPEAQEEVETEQQPEVKVEKTEVEEIKAKKEPVKVVHSVNVDHTGYQPKEMIPTTFFLPGTEDAPRGSAAGGGFEYPLTNHFQIRNPNSPTASTWGFFDFEDPKEEWRGKVRPIPNFESVPHRDVKGSDFPDGAWQKDAEYMTQFLSEAKKLVNRTMEAIYAEYGVGVVGGDLTKLSEERRQQRELFAPWKVVQDINDDAEWAAKNKNMWTTKDSLDGLARRIIHAIMTQDTFHITLGGHSAAAGHGNGHNQSYIIQAGHVLEPVFAHLGVALRSYNTAQGGLGTVQQAMAGMDLRGKESDVIMWDSSMTEKSQELHTFFMKTALISGNRAPFLMSYYDLREFGKVAKADVGYHGEGWNGPETLNEKQALEVPWAARFLNCPRTSVEICKAHEYEGNGCWVERPDFKPPTEQNKQPGGQTSWHPGNRIHKIRGRRIALLILRGLEHALNKWDELTAGGSHPLADEHWHVTEYYKNIKEKAVDVPGCPKLDANPIGSGRRRGLRANETERQLAVEYWPWRICNLPLQGRSLFGPRAVNPVETSLVAILKPNPMGDLDPTPNNAYLWPPVYYPPELIGPWNVVPENDVDVVEVAGARRLKEVVSIDDNDKIIPGYGIDIKWGRPGHCDGSSHSWCDKHEGSNCLMGNTQDSHGMICFNDLSGWLVFDVKGVKHGFIGAKMESWHTNKENKVTAGWTEVNNGGTGNYNATGRQRRLLEQNQRRMILEENNRMLADLEREVLQNPEHRHLKGGKSCGYGPEDYTFEFAINGKIVSWNKKQFCEQYTRLAYNTDMIRFMDDEKMTGDFELAMRLKSTGSNEEMCITHLYWA